MMKRLKETQKKAIKKGERRMNKEVKMIQLRNGMEAELTLYPELQEAIQVGWSSMYFPTNDVTFASLKIKNHLIALVTNGEIEVVSLENPEHSLRNHCEQELRPLIQSKAIFDEHQYEIRATNWFELEALLMAEESADGTHVCEYIESEVFEHEPESEESFIEIFVKLATDWYEDLTSYELYEDVI